MSADHDLIGTVADITTEDGHDVPAGGARLGADLLVDCERLDGEGHGAGSQHRGQRGETLVVALSGGERLDAGGERILGRGRRSGQ
jgi:hypothetical protein